MIVGGVFIAFLLFSCAFAIARYASWIPAIVPALVGAFGVLWVVTGVLSLVRRSKAAITIDEAGITIPQGSLVRPRAGFLIPRAVIASIGKHESIKGRMIEVTLTTGDKIPIQARHYCELKTFLSYCKDNELPTI
jgi:hypothetical protein